MGVWDAVCGMECVGWVCGIECVEWVCGVQCVGYTVWDGCMIWSNHQLMYEESDGMRDKVMVCGIRNLNCGRSGAWDSSSEGKLVCGRAVVWDILCVGELVCGTGDVRDSW